MNWSLALLTVEELLIMIVKQSYFAIEIKLTICWAALPLVTVWSVLDSKLWHTVWVGFCTYHLTALSMALLGLISAGLLLHDSAINSSPLFDIGWPASTWQRYQWLFLVWYQLACLYKTALSIALLGLISTGLPPHDSVINGSPWFHISWLASTWQRCQWLF